MYNLWGRWGFGGCGRGCGRGGGFGWGWGFGRGCGRCRRCGFGACRCRRWF